MGDSKRSLEGEGGGVEPEGGRNLRSNRHDSRRHRCPGEGKEEPGASGAWLLAISPPGPTSVLPLGISLHHHSSPSAGGETESQKAEPVRNQLCKPQGPASRASHVFLGEMIDSGGVNGNSCFLTTAPCVQRLPLLVASFPELTPTDPLTNLSTGPFRSPY